MTASSAAFYLIGAGRVGETFARALRLEHRLAGVWTRSGERQALLARELSVRADADTIPGDLAAGTVVIVAVPDRVVERVLKSHPQRSDSSLCWLHTSGSLGVDVFRRAGVAGDAGVAHPLYSFGNPRTDMDEIAGGLFGLMGDQRAIEAGMELAESLRCETVTLPEGSEVPYHLAATLVSNGVYALLHAAQTVLSSAGLSDERLLRGLARLAEQSAHNAAMRGISDATTGPVVRGDANTVRRHRAWLRDAALDTDALYDALARQLLEVAELRGLSPMLAGSVASVLSERPLSFRDLEGD